MANNTDKVHEAIQKSRFNETVVVNVGDEGREILLIPCLDEENGGIIWNDLVATIEKENQEGNDNQYQQQHGSSQQQVKLDIGIVRHLRTKQWFFPMLNDTQRNQRYDKAIRAASEATVKRFRQMQEAYILQKVATAPPPNIIRVLDIGAGTGLLGMMAARYLQQAMDNNKTISEAANTTLDLPEASVQVTSLEMSAAMSRLARLTIKDNNLQDKLAVLESHSTDNVYHDEESPKASLCVSELLESSLLREGILPALRDAWERHLKPDAIMVPLGARVYGQLVEGHFLANYWGPHDHEHSERQSTSFSAKTDVANPIRLGVSSNNEPSDRMLDGGARGGFVLPIHANHWMSSASSSKESTSSSDTEVLKLKPLSDPFEAMAFDFSKPGLLPTVEGRRMVTTVQPHTSGVLHAILFWWELDLWRSDDDGEGGSTYSTQSGKEPWQDHWHQCLFIFTNPASQQGDFSVTAGKECHVVACHNDTSCWFSVGDDCEAAMRTNDEDDHGTSDHPTKRIKRQHTDPENALKLVPTPDSTGMEEPTTQISPFRAWQLNDKGRREFLRRGIRSALEKKGKNAIVLDLSDFSWCAIIAALEGASRVSSIESSSGIIPSIAARVAQLANGLPKDGCHFQILQCHAEQLSPDLLNGPDDDNTMDLVQIVVGEPYYGMLEGWHLQEALNYLYLIQSLRKRGIVAKDAISVPSFAAVKGCAIESLQLRSAYRRCGADGGSNNNALLCGFDHREVNRHGDFFHEYDLSLPMWEYDFAKLGPSFELARLSYDGSLSNRSSSTRTPFERTGTCHGILVWVEYGMNNDEICNHATLGRSYRQLIRMLRTPIVLDESSFSQYELVCHFAFGNQKGLESYTIGLNVEKVG